ncbi:MAG: hypothetical protein ACP5F6_05910 [Microbacter sp.]
MKRIALFIGLLIMVSAVYPQGKPNNHQQRLNEIRQKKIEFIQQRVQLTPQEAQQFWPLYHEYEQKRWDLMKASRETFQQDRGLKERNADYAEMTENMINFDLVRAQLAKTYYERFKKILPPEKLFQYYMADREFKEWLLKDIQRQAQQHPHH